MKQNKIDKLIYLFAKLPGIGARSAKRIALHLIKNKDRAMMPLAEAIFDVSRSVQVCSVCNNIDESVICAICSDQKRNKKMLCIVESIIDLWAIENAKFYSGIYYILGCTLSVTSGTDPKELNIEKMLDLIDDLKVEEVIIATNATMEGQTTAFYITEKLKNKGLKITRFAHGIPIGGEFDYMDEVTISTAFNSRQFF